MRDKGTGKYLAKPPGTPPTDPDYRHPSFYPKPEPMTRKRSVAITLGALGVAAVGFAMVGGNDVQRNSYNSREDCEHDYATGQCEVSAGVNGGGFHYYGPWYRSDWRGNSFRGDPGPGRTYAGGGSASTHGPTGFDFGSRGGFGSSGRVSARGG